MPEDRSADDAGPSASERVASRPKRRLFPLLGFGWLTLGIAWLIAALTGFSGLAGPWHISLGILYLVLGIMFLMSCALNSFVKC
jgi:apolipoprotein N-acyltransferase